MVRATAAKARLSGDLRPPEVQAGEEGVVVEHLLEVGDQPALVHGVAGEAAADLVVDAAVGHGGQGAARHRPRPGEPSRRRPPAAGTPGSPPGGTWAARRSRRGPGRRRPPAPGRPRRSASGPGAAPPAAAGGWPGGGPGRRRPRPPRRGAPPTPRGPRASTLREAGTPWRASRREVGAAEEGLALGGEEGGQRPPGPARQRGDRVQVDAVDVGPFLAVHLDGHEPLVDEPGGAGVGERLAGHHVAPVAGRVAHRQQDRHAPLAGGGERLLAPGVPVDRVVGVGQQVGAGGGGEAVGGGRGMAGDGMRRRSLPSPDVGRARLPTGAKTPSEPCATEGVHKPPLL